MTWETGKKLREVIRNSYLCLLFSWLFLLYDSPHETVLVSRLHHVPHTVADKPGHLTISLSALALKQCRPNHRFRECLRHSGPHGQETLNNMTLGDRQCPNRAPRWRGGRH